MLALKKTKLAALIVFMADIINYEVSAQNGGDNYGRGPVNQHGSSSQLVIWQLSQDQHPDRGLLVVYLR